MRGQAAAEVDPSLPARRMHRAGPFGAFGQTFVVDTNDDELAEAFSTRFVDLRRQDAENTETAALVYEVGPTGPQWHRHSWGVWRDGETVRDQAVKDFTPSTVLYDLPSAVMGRLPSALAVRAAALDTERGAVVLFDSAADPGQKPAPWWTESVLAAWLMKHGWGLVSHQSVLSVPGHSGSAVVQPFWRPFGVDEISPISGLVDAPLHRTGLVPASSVGRLAGAQPLVAVVAVKAVTGDGCHAEPLAKSHAVRDLAHRLLPGATGRRESFRRLADVVESVSTHQVDIGTDDLDGAAATLKATIGAT